ncbi:MAG: invasion associated locus B family protein [Rhodomicrobium sp.]
MQARLLLSAMLIPSLASLAAAQSFQTQQEPVQPPKPAAAAPKPKAGKKPGPAFVAVPATPKARLLEKIGDWSVFIYEDAGSRVCFAAAAPTEMQPKTAKRTPVVFYVTDWPKDGVRNEISVKLGYSIKAKSAAAVTAGSQHFALPGDEDKAYAKDVSEEQKLLAAMAGGGMMVVKATSAKGTATTDQYSLEGASAAVRKLKEACP